MRCFSITEVRWGLTAAIIIPQLGDAIGVRQVRRYALTGERLAPKTRAASGLVHEVVPLADLETAGNKVVEQTARQRPAAMAETKALALESSFGGMGVDDDAIRGWSKCIRRAGRRRRRRGLASFAEKRAGELESSIPRRHDYRSCNLSSNASPCRAG